MTWEVGLLGLGLNRSPVWVGLLTSPSFEVVLSDMWLPLTTGGERYLPGTRERLDPALVLPRLARQAIEVVHVLLSLTG